MESAPSPYVVRPRICHGTAGWLRRAGRVPGLPGVRTATAGLGFVRILADGPGPLFGTPLASTRTSRGELVPHRCLTVTAHCCPSSSCLSATFFHEAGRPRIGGLLHPLVVPRLSVTRHRPMVLGGGSGWARRPSQDARDGALQMWPTAPPGDVSGRHNYCIPAALRDEPFAHQVVHLPEPTMHSHDYCRKMEVFSSGYGET